MKRGVYQKFIKRFLDILFSFTLIVVLSFSFLVISVLNLIFLGRPVFFIQERIGLNNKVFKLIKFKSMRNINENQDNSDEKRINRYGKIIRALSIDELPELFNIFIGNMSFIGPRPLLVEYLPLYNEKQIRRHEVLPGLTGLAQVNGRNLLTWDEKFNYDVFYVDHVSFWLDVKIFFKTILVVFKRKGISQEGKETAEKFKGNQ